MLNRVEPVLACDCWLPTGLPLKDLLMAIIKVLLIDSQASFSGSLLALLNAEPDIAVVCDAVIPFDVGETFGKIPTDVVVINVSWPLSEYLDAIHTLRKKEPGLRIVAFSGHEDPETMFLVLNAGANALLLARTEDQKKIADAVRAVYGGGTYVSNDAAEIMIPHYIDQRETQPIASSLKRLSSREREILNLVIDGKPNSEIARRLAISPKSVDTYRSRLMKKLGVKDLPSLVKFAIRHDLISSDTV